MRRHAPSPSLGQIAKEAGVSRAAVSMALRNHPRIPPETRERIQEIATRLGWLAAAFAFGDVKGLWPSNAPG